MPWSIDRNGSTLHVKITLPIEDWEALFDAIQTHLGDKPKSITLPAKLEGSSKTDRDMLKMLWRALNDLGIPVLPPV